MPHAIIEYSGNVEEDVLTAGTVALVHGVMMKSGLFEANAIKTRAHVADDWMVGEKGQDGSFLHLSVAIMEGRTPEQKQTLSALLFDRLRKALPEVDSVTVEIRDLDKGCYRKIG